MRQLSMEEELQEKVNVFNLNHSIGDKFNIKRKDGIFTTKSKASILSGHTAVVWFNEFSSCYDIDHLIPYNQPPLSKEV